jgi:hypothetical protein
MSCDHSVTVEHFQFSSCQGWVAYQGSFRLDNLRQFSDQVLTTFGIIGSSYQSVEAETLIELTAGYPSFFQTITISHIKSQQYLKVT